ncbi:murein transglycosylase [Tanticharoenia sakaeratensis NBRC 103193]|uniref:Murein transglycosylase n=2 Tax=Tanticharoenia TaxID=444052 RepID=A0A0D6MIC1_9PROT|nr:murein transglycosylase [Tanticharoenia sakaeratensis NBRC 103193]
MWATRTRMTPRAAVRPLIAVLAPLLLPGCSGAAPQQDDGGAIPPAVETPGTPVAASPDAIRARLADWLRLVSDDRTIPAADYASFLAQTPRWPDRGLMQARFAHALAERTDDTGLASLCPTATLTYAPALLACARVTGAQAVGARARTAWIDAVDRPADEAAFLPVFGQYLTATDQWRRFQRQLSAFSISAAGRQIDRLTPTRQPLARALLAYRARSDDADRLLGLLSSDEQSDPQLVLYRLHALRRAGDFDGGLTLWQSQGLALQKAHPGHDWTEERAAFARALMLAGRSTDAVLLADDETLPSQDTDRLEADFLTGWLALRTGHDPVRAQAAFRPLTSCPALLTRSRGWYWLARAKAASGDQAGARSAYLSAAAMPTTFYGQLALEHLGPGTTPTLDTPAALLAPALARLPQIAALPVDRLPRRDLAMAAQMLSSDGDQNHARDFLMMAQAEAHTASELAALADLSHRLGLAEPAIYAARAAGRRGTALYPAGWPDDLPVPATALPPGLTQAVIRQESSFNPTITSPAGAVGLLQLRPASARDIARWAGLAGLDTSAASLRNPATNITLGQAFLNQLAQRYGSVVPYMLAAYNAGPHRADQWILPDAATDPDTLIDWIERVPYEETRSYIERIEESAAIYRVEASRAQQAG